MTTTVPAGAPVAAADPTAVLGRRYLAAVIDLGILWAFTVTFWLLASEPVPPALDRLGVSPCGTGDLCSNVNGRYVDGWPMGVLVIVWIAYLVGVFVVQRGLTGRTVGTMLTGVVVVGDDGRPLGPGRALLRSIAGIVDYLPCCLPVVGIATSAATTGHRRVGDMAASSHVVGADRFGTPLAAAGSTAPHPAPAAPGIGTAYRYPTRPPTPDAGRPPAAPASPPTAAVWAPPQAAAPSPGPAPQGAVWDEQRRAYLQWDPARGQWLQFDQATQEWQQYDQATGRWRPVDR